MAFAFQPYDNSQSIGQILTLMQAGAHAHADAARATGDAQARAAAISSQNSAQMADTIGHIALGVSGQIAHQFSPEAKAQQENIAAQTAERQAQAQDREHRNAMAAQEQQSRQRLNGLLQESTITDPTTGLVTYDRNKLTTGLTSLGLGDKAPEYLKLLDNSDAAVKTARAAQTDALKQIATVVDATGNDPVVFGNEVKRAISNGVISERMAAPYLAAVQRDPEHVGRVTGALLGRQPSLMAVKPGETVIDKNNPTAPPVMTSPVKPDKTTFEQKNVTLDGKPNQLVNYNPQTGQMFIPGSADPIPAARIRGNTPPSVVIRNENRAAATMPDFALTDARPSGPDANKPDPTIRMTPNGLHQAALNFIATGQYPPTGRGSDPASLAQREAINAKVGAVAAASGMDMPTLRAFYKSNAGSLAQQQKAADSVQAFMATADRNADQLKAVLTKIPDTGIPIFNQPLRAFADQVKGDPNMSKMATYLQSVQNEYARIVSQPNLAGQLTDSARQEGERLVKPNATVGQMLTSIEALRTEGDNRLVSIGEQIQRIQQRMQTGPQVQPQTAAPQAPQAAPAGQIIVTAPDGSKHPFATQAQADAFKRLAGIR